MPKRSFNKAIEVKSPCSESWDEMTGNDQVRFCSHCAKDVHNVSKATRREAIRLVRRSNGRVCVRYEVHPIKRTPIFAPRAARLIRQTGIAAGLITASLALAEAAYAQGGALGLETVRVEQTDKTGSTGSVISGYVTDPAGAAIPFAVVSISNIGTYEYRAVNANGEGFYEFKDLTAGSYTIKFEAGGFNVKQIENISLSESGTVRRDARMELQQVAEVVEIKAGGDYEGSVSGGIGIVTLSESVERNALVMAVMNEDLEEVQNLITRGAKLNSRDKGLEGITPLHAAIETGNIEIMQLLLAYGAKPNSRDYQKRTPLMMLDEDGEKEMVRILIAYGANPGLVDAQKNSVLHHFAEFDEPEMMRYLIEHGANPNGRNKAGRTPLMIAAENDNAEVLRVLLENGADIRAVTKRKETAWDLAGGSDSRKMLETFGLLGVSSN